LWERVYVQDLGVAGRIILKWILGKREGEAWTDVIWFRIGASDWLL